MMNKSKSHSRSTDYLDAHGVHANFVTGKPYSSAYRELAKSKWATLPVYKDRTKVKEILTSLRDNAVTVVISATGSGKSVIIPRLAMKHMMSLNADCRLGMTFPKSVLAEQSAKFASQTWDVVLGQHVGYQFRGAPPSSHGSDTRALFMTDGTLFTISRRDPLFSKLDIVIIDEAHERSVQTDLLLERLREALIIRPALRLIIMSATIDPGIFIQYFSKTTHPKSRGLKSAVVHVAGQPIFDILHHWEHSRVSPEDFLSIALQRAAEFLDALQSAGSGSEPVSDVLVFVPTTKDATKGCKLLKDSDLAVRATTLCEGLYRKLPDLLKQAVIHDRPESPLVSKLIFATPIAESSITFSSLAAVVDSGLQLSSVWLPLEQATRVTRDMTSKAQISQRVGRVGRVAPGDAYHIYTEAQYRTLKDFPDPAILHTDLTEHFLAELCRTGITVSKVLEDCSNLITPPTSDHTRSVINTLQQLGLLQKESGAVTELGQFAQRLCEMFKVSLSGSMLLLGGILVECRADALVLACILEEVKGEILELWSATVVATGDPRRSLRVYCDELSDHISLVRIYREGFLTIKYRSKRESNSVSLSALNMDVWERIHARITLEQPRYDGMSPKLDITAATVLVPAVASHTSFRVSLLRAVAFARRHRQLVFRKKGLDVCMACSAGPLKSSICTAKALLARSECRPSACVGGLYDDLNEVGGKVAFSVISWIC